MGRAATLRNRCASVRSEADRFRSGEDGFGEGWRHAGDPKMMDGRSEPADESEAQPEPGASSGAR